jgi:parallel beta-helix repeat protein
MKGNIRSVAATIVLCVGLVAGLAKPASATTLCVNPGGTNGCFATIGAAVAAATAAAAANDIINVAPGTYKEDVIIGIPLSLVGAGPNRTVIDATGLSNGIYVDGLDNAGLSNVVVTGFTVKNANFEGILVTNASGITISNNSVSYNDKSLEPATPACPGEPSFETGEDFDCGEGIHLLGADHSVVANNVVANNSGGILQSDDTAAVHDNLIIGNIVHDNPFDCGIVMASHAPAPMSGAAHNGVVHNTIANNQSFHNGTQVPGAGAGVGLFSDGSGPGLVSGNVVINNLLRNNGIPGVAVHSHAPGDTFTNNVIAANHISGNGADTADTATPGPTGININSGFGGSLIAGTVIAQNFIDQEGYDLFINTPAQVDAHFNSFIGRNAVGVDNSSGNAVNVTENWWGCFGGPGAEGCSSIEGSALFNPWLEFPFGAGGPF